MPEFLDSQKLAESRTNLISDLKRRGILKSRIVEEALVAIPREEFLWDSTPNFLAYEDEPLGLDDTGQTISAPHMVVIMLEELHLSPGLRILEVGGGSGYNAALMGWIVSRYEKKSKLVTTVERNERLASFAKANISRLGLLDVVEVVTGDGSLGFPHADDREIYDRIVVTAAAANLPLILKRQLKTGGIMLVPIGGMEGQVLVKIKKASANRGGVAYEESRLMECVFVPLISDSIS